MSILSDGIDSFAGSEGLPMMAFSWRWLEISGRWLVQLCTVDEVSHLSVRGESFGYIHLPEYLLAPYIDP